jgi:hypothetical protein
MLRKTRVRPNSMASVTTTNWIVLTKIVPTATSVNTVHNDCNCVFPMDAIFVEETSTTISMSWHLKRHKQYHCRLRQRRNDCASVYHGTTTRRDCVGGGTNCYSRMPYECCWESSFATALFRITRVSPLGKDLEVHVNHDEKSTIIATTAGSILIDITHGIGTIIAVTHAQT